MSNSFSNFDKARVPSPCYVVDEVKIEENLKILQRVQQESGAKILLALKAFSMFSLAPLISRYLSTYSAAFKPNDFDEILGLSDHLVFNSFNQWKTYKEKCLMAAEQRPKLSFGLRINPEHSEGSTAIYDPCAPCSRMGIPIKNFNGENLDGISGLHFHTLCEQDFAPLERTLNTVEEKFGHILPAMRWINFGGGHHITRENYQVDALIERIKKFQNKYHVQVYLEPGEAIALDSGIFVCEVLDTINNGMDLAILDASATCHMPDVLEMPYRPLISGAGEPGAQANTYRLGGPSCLAGDVIGDYSFNQPLKIGDRLQFEDMAIYTMVKNTTFNGINLPSIAIWNSKSDKLNIVREFGHQDFKQRLS